MEAITKSKRNLTAVYLKLFAPSGKKGIHCAVASNKDDDHVQILSKKLFPGLFDISIGRNPKMAIKPDPEMILSIARRLGIKSKRNRLYR